MLKNFMPDVPVILFSAAALINADRGAWGDAFIAALGAAISLAIYALRPK